MSVSATLNSALFRTGLTALHAEYLTFSMQEHANHCSHNRSKTWTPLFRHVVAVGGVELRHLGPWDITQLPFFFAQYQDQVVSPFTACHLNCATLKCMNSLAPFACNRWSLIVDHATLTRFDDSKSCFQSLGILRCLFQRICLLAGLKVKIWQWPKLEC